MILLKKTRTNAILDNINIIINLKYKIKSKY